MEDNKNNGIIGYRRLTNEEIQQINIIKELEIKVGELWSEMRTQSAYLIKEYDRHWLEVADTHLEEGFSALVRSVAKPDSSFSRRNYE